MKRFCSSLVNTIFFFLCCTLVIADQWEYFIPIQGIDDVTYLHNKLYCAAGSGLFMLDVNDFTYRRVTRVEGFPAVAANKLLFENDAELLVATYMPGDTQMGSGIYRYNIESTTWHLLDSPYPPGDRPQPYVRDMARDSDGNVWILGDNSLFLIKGDTLVKQTADTGLPDGITYPISLTVDINGDLWMSYNRVDGSGIAHRQNGIWTVVLEKSSYGLGNLTVALDGTIWFDQSGSVCAYDDFKVSIYDVSVHGNNVGLIAAASDTSVWCASQDRLIRLRGGAMEDMSDSFLRSLEAAIAPHPFYAFTAVYANGDEVWVSAHCGEVYAEYTILGRYYEGKWQLFVPEPNLIYPYGIGTPGEVAVGDDGSVWMAGFFTMWPQPAVQFYNGSWRLYRDINLVYDIAFDGIDRVWFFGMDVRYYQDGEWTVFRNQDYPVFKDHLRAGAATSTSAWAGDGYGNVYRYEFGGEWIQYTSEETGVGFVTSIAADERQGVWVTGTKGVAYFDGKEWTRYTADSIGLSVRGWNSVSFGVNTTVWFATDTGLVMYKNGFWTMFTTTNSGLIHNEVTHVMTSKNGNLWIGTQSGLCQFDGAKWYAFTKDNSPLLSRYIRETTEAPDGSIWIIDNAGLCHYIPDTVTWIDNFKGYPSCPLVITGVNPNPFNSSVATEYVLYSYGTITFEVFNLAGQRVYSRSMKTMAPGKHKETWNSQTNDGEPAATGAYFLRVRIGDYSAVTKAILIK